MTAQSVSEYVRNSKKLRGVTPSSAGLNILGAASASAQRTLLGFSGVNNIPTLNGDGDLAPFRWEESKLVYGGDGSALGNLGLGSGFGIQDGELVLSGVLRTANNLSDLASASTARTNLGLTSLATATPGTGVLTAVGNAVNASGGLVTFSGNIGAATGTSLALDGGAGQSTIDMVGTGGGRYRIGQGATIGAGYVSIEYSAPKLGITRGGDHILWYDVSNGDLILNNTFGGSSVLSLSYGGTKRWNVNSSGHFLAGTDNTYDIGASGATRPRTGYFGTNVIVGNVFAWASSSLMGAPANGNIALYNNAGNSFGMLQFGGTTSSFPAIKRNAADLEVKAADDSAFKDITAAKIWSTNGAGAYAGLSCSADGVGRLLNSAVNDFTRLTWGLATNASPALKKSSTELQCVLGDDSSYTDFRASKIFATHADGINAPKVQTQDIVAFADLIRIIPNLDSFLILENIPTTDPTIENAVWNDGGFLKISAG